MHQLIKKPAIILSTIFASFFIFATAAKNPVNSKSVTGSAAIKDSSSTTAGENAAVNTEAALYSELGLSQAGLGEQVFGKALHGLRKLSAEGVVRNDNVITIIDFTQPSNQKRLYVVDLANRKILFNTLVAHGRNSGTLYAKSFSNDASSLKSSPGFYTTAETYIGEHGFSLRLDGREKNINDNARNRAVVMHAANYVDQSAVNSLGFLGRSWGCPALPPSQYKAIINEIKGGTCLFIYTNDSNYQQRSSMLS
jgi:hypothetical protein